jgi:hypothetical protein
MSCTIETHVCRRQVLVMDLHLHQLELPLLTAALRVAIMQRSLLTHVQAVLEEPYCPTSQCLRWFTTIPVSVQSLLLHSCDPAWGNDWPGRSFTLQSSKEQLRWFMQSSLSCLLVQCVCIGSVACCRLMGGLVLPGTAFPAGRITRRTSRAEACMCGVVSRQGMVYEMWQACW